MMLSLKAFFVNVGALGLFASGIFLLSQLGPDLHVPVEEQSPLVSQAIPLSGSTSTPVQESPAQAHLSKPIATSSKVVVKKAVPIQSSQPKTQKNAQPGQIHRIENPYPFAPSSLEVVNAWVRGALVNILCTPRSGGFRTISGSGVLIDSRGVILTNAHVAQYVLLSESQQIDLRCVIRMGSPARARWTAQVMYMPSAWVDAHASDVAAEHPMGTGEHDYALLRITSSIDGSPIQNFPSLSFDSRTAVAFVDDEVLVAAYPAEFIGGIVTQTGLYPVSSITTVKDLFTISTSTPDVLSLGGIIQAQSGSSGGAVVNAWNFLVGIITTTSDGTTTGERNLHALALSYIDRDIVMQTGSDLKTILAGDIDAETNDFTATEAPVLIEKLSAHLSHQ